MESSISSPLGDLVLTAKVAEHSAQSSRVSDSLQLSSSGSQDLMAADVLLEVGRWRLGVDELE
jgi:hypothetical protein